MLRLLMWWKWFDARIANIAFLKMGLMCVTLIHGISMSLEETQKMITGSALMERKESE